MKEIQYLTSYRVLKKIASGGMGSVYLAEQTGSDGFRKIVAIKTIKREYLKNQENIDLFVGEAKLVSDLIHENVLQVYQLGQTKGIYYIVMEYAHGKNLSDFIREHKNRQKVANVEIGAFIISRVCRSLHYAHTKKDIYGRPLNVVHRDVTPSNIILTYQGVVKLTDFGIAKATIMNTPDEAEVIMGKLPYMSPEQAKFVGTTPQSDIFSLGLVMYELLTNTVVYNVNDIDDLVDKQDNFSIKRPSRLNPHIPARLEEIMMRSLEVKIENRYQTAKEMLGDLEHYMYDDRYGPTNEKLARYLARLFPWENRDAISDIPSPSASDG
ncbi:MAG: serine/threonine-protein kinase [Planctomycetota bacterium]|jgi:serine/threonine protein kinase|nr:serine/threonine-protein kinase [Planctomycetota bacterium]